MPLHRLVLAESALALRWPGAVGIALGLAAAGWGALALLPARGDLSELQARADQLERRAAALRSGAAAAPQTAASRRAQVYGALPAQAEITRHVERIYAAAAAENLSLVRGEYAAAEVPKTALARYRIVLPVKGSYGQIRRFITAATAAVPGLALDDLSLQRPNVGQPQLEARVQLSLFLVRPG